MSLAELLMAMSITVLVGAGIVAPATAWVPRGSVQTGRRGFFGFCVAGSRSKSKKIRTELRETQFF